MDSEAIKNMKYIIKRLLQVSKSFVQLQLPFSFFSLFKDRVVETQLRIGFLTPNTGVWNQLHKTLDISKLMKIHASHYHRCRILSYSYRNSETGS